MFVLCFLAMMRLKNRILIGFIKELFNFRLLFFSLNKTEEGIHKEEYEGFV